MRRGFQISITNVPGPQSPLYAAGARMIETYPVHPLQPGHALSIGVTSYDGSVFYGITADRDVLPDVDVLGQCVTEALDELMDTATGARPKVPAWSQEGRTEEDDPRLMSVRVYVPVTSTGLAGLVAEGRLSGTVPRARRHARAPRVLARGRRRVLGVRRV